jgi:hypothetical protein
MQDICNSVAFEGDYIKYYDLLHEKKNYIQKLTLQSRHRMESLLSSQAKEMI